MHDIRDMEANAARDAEKPKNRYDDTDIVRRVFLMNAEGLKFASYRVRDLPALLDRNEERFSSLQHHLTYVPVKALGGMMMVNEIGATIYAMLEDDQALHLAEVMEKVAADGGFDEFGPSLTFIDLERSKTVIQVYKHPHALHLEFQIMRDAQILGVLPLHVAKMFCTLAGRARGGEAGMVSNPPSDNAPEVAAEVDRSLKAPMEQVTAADLDGVD
jgi:hypothetical protein